MTINSKQFLFLFLVNIVVVNSISLKNNDFFNKDIRSLVKKISRLSFSIDNEPLINNLEERFKKYIFNNDMKRPESPREKYYNMSRLKSNFTVEEDGTYDLYSHEIIEFNEGYQVSFETSFDDYTFEDYDEICYKLSLMSDNSVYLGVWNGDAEFSFYFEDFDLAIAVAILFNQNAIWDWKVGNSIFNIFHKEF